MFLDTITLSTNISESNLHKAKQSQFCTILNHMTCYETTVHDMIHNMTVHEMI